MFQQLAKMNTWMIYLVLFLITVFAAYFIIALVNFFGRVKASFKKGGKKKSSMGLVSIMVIILFVAFLFVVFRIMILYAPLNGETLIAKVSCQKVAADLGDLKLNVAFFEKGEQLQSENYIIRGNRWLVKGEILQWASPFGYLGLKQTYRLTHVLGQYVNVEGKSRSNSYTLIRDDQNSLWRILVSTFSFVGVFRIQTVVIEPQVPDYREAKTIWISKNILVIRSFDPKIDTNRNNTAKQRLEIKKQKNAAYPERDEDVKR
jgi:hypothetical protein